MRKLFLAFFFLLFSTVAFAQLSTNPATVTIISISDDTTTVYNPYNISFPSGSITDDGDGSATINQRNYTSNLVFNGSFQYFYSGTAAQPDAYTSEGTPTILRDTGEDDNFHSTNYAVKYTATGAGNEGGYITLSNLKGSTSYMISVRAKATAGDTARMLTTGATTNADEETASATWVTLSEGFTTDATPTNVVIKLVAKADGDIVWFDKLMVVEGFSPFAFSPHIEDSLYKQSTSYISPMEVMVRMGDADPTYEGRCTSLVAYAAEANGCIFIPFDIPAKIEGKTTCIDEITVSYGISDIDVATNNTADYIENVLLYSNDQDESGTVRINHTGNIGNDSYDVRSSHNVVDAMYEMVASGHMFRFKFIHDANLTDVEIYDIEVKYHTKVHE